MGNFYYPCRTEVVRIRTGERGEAAIRLEPM